MTAAHQTLARPASLSNAATMITALVLVHQQNRRLA